MKRLVLLIGLMAPLVQAAEFDTLNSEIYLNAFTRFTPEVRRSFPELEALESDSELIKNLKIELLKCGVSTTEKNCLDSKDLAGKSYTFKKIGEDGYRYFIKGIKNQYDDYVKAIQIVKVHAENKKITFDSLDLFETRILDNYSAYKTFFFNSEKAATFSSENFDLHDFEEYISKFNLVEDAKSIYHSSLLALSTSSSIEQSEILKEEMAKKMNVFASCIDPTYQNEILDLLKKEVLFDLDSFKLVGQSFIKSTDKAVSKKAAVELAKLGESSEEIKKLLDEAFVDLSFSIQIDALNALFKIRGGLVDDVKIINMMKSISADVSKEAFKLSKLMELTDEHLDTLIELYKTDNNQFRGFVTELVAKVQTDKASRILISVLTDPSDKVAQKAFEYLKKRELNEELLNQAKSLRSSKVPHTRYFSLYFIAKTKSKENYDLIYDFLADYNNDSSSMALRILNSSEIEFLDRGKIMGLFEKNRTRKAGISLLSKYEDDASFNHIIETIKYLNKDDIEYTYKILKNKNLGVNQLYSLKKTYKTLDPDTKEAVIKLMAKIEDQKTLDWAKKMRRRTLIRNFKEMLDKLIKHLQEKLNS